MSWYDELMKEEKPRQFTVPTEQIQPQDLGWYDKLMGTELSYKRQEELAAEDVSEVAKRQGVDTFSKLIDPTPYIETAKHLGMGALAFFPSLAAGAGQLIREKGTEVLGYMAEGPFPGRERAFKQKLAAAKSLPEYKEIYESEMYKKARNELHLESLRKSPKQMRAAVEDAAGLMTEYMTGWMDPPKTEGAKAALELVDITLNEVLLHYPHQADKYLTEKGYPNLGWLTGIAGELWMFKNIHSAAKEIKPSVKGVKKSINKYMDFLEDIRPELRGDISPKSVAKVKDHITAFFDELDVPKKAVATPETLQAYINKEYVVPKGDFKQSTNKQKKTGHQLARELKMTEEQRRTLAEEVTGTRSMKEMTRTSASEFIKTLRDMKEKPLEAKPIKEIKEVEKVREIDTAESLAKEFDLRYMGESEGLEYYSMKVPDGETTLTTKGISRDALVKRVEEVKEQFKIEKVKEEITEPIAEKPKEVRDAEEVRREVREAGEKERIEREEERQVRLRDVERDRLEARAREAKEEIAEEPISETAVRAIADDIITLEDMGFYAEVSEMLGEGMKVGTIMKELKQKPYYKEDMADFGYTEKDIRSAIRAAKTEIGDIKAVKDIQKEIVKEEKAVERIEKIEIEPKMSKNIKSIYNEIMSELPDYIKRDIEVESIHVGVFPVEYRGEGGRTKIIGKLKEPEKYQIFIEKGEKDIKETLRHELLHTYILKHPERLKTADGMFSHEKAVDLLEKESVGEVPLERVDPITGRPPGMERVFERPERLPDEIREQYLLEQQPLTGETGKVLKTKFAAERRVKDLGKVGELVENPKGEGWLIKESREERVKRDKAEAEQWEEILKEEEGELRPEGDRVDIDPDAIFDPFRSERGAITIREKHERYKGIAQIIRTDANAPEINQSVNTYVRQKIITLEEGNRIIDAFNEYQKTIGRFPTVEKIAQKARIPDLVSYDKTDVGYKSLLDVLESERGAITLDSKTVKQIKDFVRRGIFSRNRAIRELRTRGVSDKELLKVFPDASVQNLNRVVESKWLKAGQDPMELLPRRKLSDDMKAPAVTRGEAHMMATMNDIPARLTAEHLSWENAIRTFEKLPTEVKETFYRTVKEGESLTFDRLQNVIKRSKKIRNSVSYTSHKRIGVHAIAQQPDGLTVLAQQGITKIPKLRPKELKAYEDLRSIYNEFLPLINKARIASGEKPFPAVENYFTWIQDLNWLEKTQGVGLFSNWRTIESKMAETRRVPGFRFAKFRAGPELPRKLNLNPFTVMDVYAKSASHYIEMAPRLAKLNELLTEKFGMAQNTPHAYNFLRHWLNYQAGKIPAWDIAHPTTRKAMQVLNSNIVYSLLTYNTRSALIQPAALASSYTMIGEYYTGVGISHVMSPAKWKMAGKKSNILNTRSPEVAIYEAMEIGGKLPGQIKKGAAKVGIAPLTALDSVAARITWMGAYEQGLKKLKLSERKAINRADDIVTKTQASAARSDVAPIQRTQLGKTVTCLQTFVINHWGFLTKDVLGIKNAKMDNPTTVKRVLRFILATTAVNAFYEDGLRMNSPNPTPIRAYLEEFEETEDHLKAFARSAKEIAEYVPLWGGRLRYGSEIGGPVLTELLKLIGEGDTDALIKLIGVPGANQFFKMVRAYERSGTPVDVVLGRYIEPPKKPGALTAPIDRGKGLAGIIKAP